MVACCQRYHLKLWSRIILLWVSSCDFCMWEIWGTALFWDIWFGLVYGSLRGLCCDLVSMHLTVGVGETDCGPVRNTKGGAKEIRVDLFSLGSFATCTATQELSCVIYQLWLCRQQTKKYHHPGPNATCLWNRACRYCGNRLTESKWRRVLRRHAFQDRERTGEGIINTDPSFTVCKELLNDSE